MGERPRYTGVFERLDAEYHMVTFDGPLPDFYRRDIEEEQWSALDGPVAGERAVFGSPVEAAALVQAFAISAGADLVGTTVLHDHIVFEGVDIPHGWAVSLAMEMDYSRIITAPEPPSAQEVLRVYWRLGWVVCRTAAFIRSLGYPATAHHPRASTGRPPTVLHTMAAIEAGLGELGRNGLVITEEFGPRIRFGTVTTDLPLPEGGRREFGVDRFCRRCHVCEEHCEDGAIPAAKTIVRGFEKYTIDPDRCLRNFARYDGCNICVARCLFNRRPDA
ncbi:MAG TPA: hypothetical protein EYP43_02295 [Thermoplasmata archaeon]|nr:hypothetical protein [Thermoplasmata archaeon]